MRLESDAKFEEKLTCGLENDMSNLANSHQITGKSQNWDFDGILLSKVENVWPEKWELWGVMCHDNKEWCKIWRGTDLSVQNWHEKFAEFWPEHSKNLKNLYFAELLLTKVYVWAKKVQRSYIWWHWRMMQNLEKNWLVLPKITWAIWQIFTRAFESLKIGALMWSFYSK